MARLASEGSEAQIERGSPAKGRGCVSDGGGVSSHSRLQKSVAYIDPLVAFPRLVFSLSCSIVCAAKLL